MTPARAPLTALQRTLLLLVVLLPALVRLWGIDDGLLGPDEWRETETATIARNFLTEPDPLYPRINWGAPGPGYVEAELQLLPWTVHLGYRILGPEPWLGRAFAVLLTALSTWVMFRLARRLMSVDAALLAAFAFTSAPLVFRYGRAFMPEALVLLFYLVAADRFAAWLRSGRWRHVVAAGAALAVAVLVKPTSVHVGLVAGVLAFWRGGARLLFSPQMLAFGAIALLPAALYYAHAAWLHLTYGNSFGVISGGDSKWGNAEFWFDPAFYRALLRMDVVYGMGWGGSLLAAAALLTCRRRPVAQLCAVWLAVLLLYYLIVARYAGHESRGLHYHVYAVVPLALATAAGAVIVRRWLRRRLQARLPAAVGRLALALVALPLLAMAAQQWRGNLRHLRQSPDDLFLRAGRALAAVSEPEDPVVVTSTDVAVDQGITNNFEEPKVLFHAWRRGRMLPRDRLNAANLRAALARTGARYVVVLDRALDGATANFRTALEQFEVAAAGDGFRVLRVGV